MSENMKRKYQNKKVSIIIPVYNSEQYIKNTLESVLNQTYQDFEIIVIDDCSNDSSKEIINKMTERDSRLIYRLQERNCGVAVARNTALDLSTGRYIAFLDSDDEWKKNKLEKQLRLMEEKQAGFVFSAIEMMDETGQRRKEIRKIVTEVTYSYLLKNTVIPTSSVLIDRNIIDDFKMPLMRSGQDYAAWLRILRSGMKAYGINEALVKYRVGKNSLSSNKLKSVKQVWGIQVHQEGLNPIYASYNTCWFIYHALIKYLF